MSAANTNKWIGIGLLGLPLYGALTFWSSLDPQPDPNTQYEAWAHFVTTDYYLLKHLLGSLLSMVFAIFGTFALGAYFSRSRAGELGVVAMVITVLGSVLSLTIGGVSTFAAPQEGQAYLAGIEEYSQMEPVLAISAQTWTFLLAILLMFVGNVLLGVAVWRSGTLPKWAGAIWVVSTLMFYALGAVLGMATTNSSLVTQPIGALLMVISGGWMAWRALHRPSAETVDVQAQPSLQ